MGEVETKKSFVSWHISTSTAKAKFGPMWSQETPFRSPIWCHGPHLAPSSTAFSDVLAGESWIISRTARTQTSPPFLAVSITNASLSTVPWRVSHPAFSKMWWRLSYLLLLLLLVHVQKFISSAKTLNVSACFKCFVPLALEFLFWPKFILS